MNGSPSVKVGQFNRDSGSKIPCKWDLGIGIYNYEQKAQWYDVNDFMSCPSTANFH
jgi:hypothetical protein